MSATLHLLIGDSFWDLNMLQTTKAVSSTNVRLDTQ